MLTTRSATLSNYADLARASGMDPYALLAEVGLPASCLLEAEQRIPVDKVALLLELTARRSGEEAFGLLLSEQRRASNLGPLVLLAREEPTLRQALQALARYSHLHTEAIFVSVEEEAGTALIRMEMLAGDTVPTRQGAELSLAVLFGMLRFFLGDEWRPRTVSFTHGAPKDRQHHRRIFGTRLEFGQAFTGMVCDARDLDMPLPWADPVMGRYVRRYLDEQDAQTRQTMSHKVRQLVLLLLPSGRSNIDSVARALGLTRRTIHRHLAGEDLTFSAILDSVRGELALRYLERRERPLSEVAALLGFSEPSAFSRWFRAAFGQSPTQHQARRSADSTPLP